MPTAVGVSEGLRESQFAVNKSAPLRATALSCLWLSIPGQEAEDVLSGVLNITQDAMVKRRRNYRSI